jgi:uracil-DNA glycosylase family 4
MHNIIEEIHDFCQSASHSLLPVLTYKGEEELRYLLRFLEREPEKEAQPDIDANAAEKSIDDDRSTYSIKEMIQHCNRCSDTFERKYSYGSGVNRVMVVLNAPIMITNVEKKIFKNDSIDLMKKMLAAITLKSEECYVTNVLKCSSKNLLHKPSTMFNNCQDILRREIEELKPLLIIVMGELMPLRKMCKQFSGCKWYNIDHPITLLKNKDLKRDAWETLKLVKEALQTLSQ